MAAFPYTYAWWNKHRPLTMAKTGLGQNLKEYEAAKATLAGAKSVTNFLNARTKLDAVEKGRKEAIAKCGLTDGKLKADLKAANAQAQLDGLVQTLESALTAKADGWQDQVDDQRGKLQRKIANLETLIEAYEKGRPTKEQTTQANGIINEQQKDAPSRGLNALGEDFDDFKRCLRSLKPLMPEIATIVEAVQAFGKELQDLTSTRQNLVRELHGLVGELVLPDAPKPRR